MNSSASLLQRLWPVATIALIIGLFVIFDGSRWLNVNTLVGQKDALQSVVGSNPVLSFIVFIVFYTIAVAASLPGATILSVSAGFLFGQWLGTAAVVLGATSGAIALYWIVQTSLGDSLCRRAGPWFDKIAAGFQEGAVSYMLFLRLVPLFPFFAVNIVGAMLGVRSWVFGWTTALGILPGAAVFVSAGVGLDSAVTQGTIFTTQIALAFTGLGLISLIPVGYRFWKNRRSG